MIFVPVVFHPHARVKQHRQWRVAKRIDERLAALKRFFQIGERESGIHGGKGPLGIGCFQGGVRAARLLEPVAITLRRRVASSQLGYANVAVRTHQSLQFSRLVHIPSYQD